MGAMNWSLGVPLILTDEEADFAVVLRRTPKDRIVRRREQAVLDRVDLVRWRLMCPWFLEPSEALRRIEYRREIHRLTFGE
jgi:hypothetical protein